MPCIDQVQLPIFLFCKKENGEEEIIYDLDAWEELLKDTYGITVYQEQVMLLSQKTG
jgi:DNA polymerase-3 subunit alpha